MPNRQVHRSVDLNVTPLIDVLLVLLVIFMAALPLAQQGIDTTIPAASQTTASAARPDQIVVRYDVDGQLSINQQAVSMAELPARLREIFQSRTDKTVYILGDAALRYGAIVDIMDAAKGAGVSRVGVITDGMRRNAGIGAM